MKPINLLLADGTPLAAWHPTRRASGLRRFLTAITAAMLMLVSLAGAALADAPPANCVPGTEVTTITDGSGNVVEVVKTTTCHEDGTIDDISYERTVLAFWLADSRGNGRLVPADQMPTAPTPWSVCGRARSLDVCCP